MVGLAKRIVADRRLHQNIGGNHCIQARGQDVACDAEVQRKLIETARAEYDFANQEERPAIAQNL
jgi:hypothetical protein